MSNQPTMPLPPVPDGESQQQSPRLSAWQVALIAALTTLVLVLPMAIYLVLRGDGDHAPAARAPAPTPTPSASTAGPSPQPSTVGPPDGRIALATLQNATLDIPRWPADNVQGPHGKLRFRDGKVKLAYRPSATGQPPNGEQIVLLAVTYGDVDRDGADETVAEFGCWIEGGSKQLVAFDRDRAGHIITIGKVVSTTGEIRQIATDSAQVTAGGTITATVGDYQGSGDDQTPVRWQTRGYRWQHNRFEQVTGPTVMPANPSVTETKISAGELVLGPVVNGYRYGTVTVTVTHRWGSRPHGLTLYFYPPEGLERAGSTWPDVVDGPGTYRITVEPPAARGSRTLRFTFRRLATAIGGDLTVELTGTARSGETLSEAVQFNNGATARIRAAG